MIPVLYGPGETAFESDGLGLLSDTVSCIVTEERNGAYELTMQYPVTGQHYSEIDTDCLIKVKPNDLSDAQPFRVYKMTKPMKGIVTIDAEHISYALNANPCAGLKASGNAASALDAALRAAVVPHLFTGWSDISTSNSTEISEPCSVRSCLGGQRGSILDVWGGEYEFDLYSIKLCARRGQDTEAVIEYGKNLTDLSQEKSIGEVYTAIMPFAHKTVDDAEQYTYIPEKYVSAPSAAHYSFVRVLPVDFSDRFKEGEAFTAARLRGMAEEYISANGVGVPKIGLTVSFIPLWQTKEYEKYQLLERVNLCDTVTVRFEKLGVDVRAKVVKTVYDTLKERYTSLELGDAKSNFSKTIHSLKDDIDSAANQSKTINSLIEKAVENATHLITGANGGNVVFKTDADGKPQEILIMDTDNMSTAKKVWRWNVNGFGYSKSGINGPYGTAITMDGAIVADFITAGQMVANLIKAGRLQSSDGSVYFDLDIGELIAGKGKTTINSEGITCIGSSLFIRNRDGRLCAFANDDGFIVADVLQTDDMRFVTDGHAAYADIKINGDDEKTRLYISAERYKGYGDSVIHLVTNGGVFSINSPFRTCTVSGDLDVTGQKHACQETSHFGKRLINAYETAECYFGDIGEAEIVQGFVRIDLDPIFLECVNTDYSYQVFISPYGEGKAYVFERGRGHFIVKGDDIRFCWEIKAKRRDYETVRLEERVSENHPQPQ